MCIRDRYYYNHNTGECTWTPPRHGSNVLHAPQDYIVVNENNRVYFVKWSMSPNEAHLRMWNKPSGYRRCTKCLQNIALLECIDVPGFFCFRCFRASFDDHDFARGTKQQRRVSPVSCTLCSQGRTASWHCLSNGPGLAACSLCFTRIENVDMKWLRI